MFLERGARFLNELAEDPRGSTYTIIGSLTLTAFAFEAYLNHIGIKKLGLWDESERMGVMDKYHGVCGKLGLTPDFGRRPYQTLRRLFSFRNAVAHGKTEEVEEKKIVSADSDPHEHAPTTFWQKCLTLEFSKRAHDDVEKIIEELHYKAGGDERGPFVHGMAIGSMTLAAAGPSAPKTKLP